MFGLGLWVWRRGFIFIEMVAFLIHFDGLGFCLLRMGRIMAAVIFGVICWKLVVEQWRPPAVPVRHWLPPLMLTTFAVMTGAWSESVAGWLFAMGMFALALAYFGASALLVDSHEKIQQYLRAYWVGGLCGSGAGVLALFLGTRSVGFGGDPNFFGLLQASMIPLTVYYRRNETDPGQAQLVHVGPAVRAGRCRRCREPVGPHRRAPWPSSGPWSPGPASPPAGGSGTASGPSSWPGWRS